MAIRVPVRGPKRALLETVEHNAGEAFVRHRLQRTSDHNSRARALESLQRELSLPDAPLRIECYDMSHLQGTDYVGSMVVFEDGLPKKSDYRHFRVVVGARQRRLRGHGGGAHPAAHRPARGGGAGGPGQGVRAGGTIPIGTAASRPAAGGSPTRPSSCSSTGDWASSDVGVRVLERLGLTERIPIAALAKSFEEVYRPGSSEPIRLPRQSEALYLLQRLRDEAHRFAISYHRTLRGKRMTVGALDGIPGLGPKRRARLIEPIRGHRLPCAGPTSEELLGPIVVAGRGGRSGLRAAAHAAESQRAARTVREVDR